MTTPVLMGLSAETLRLMYAIAQLRSGNPRPYVENYFRIRDIHGELVPMRYLPLQERYHEAVFPPDWKPGQPRDVTFPKARKATVSSICVAWDTAFFLGLSGFDVAVIANSEDTLDPLSNMVDTFYKNMPESARPPIYNQVWGTEKRQVVFVDPVTKATMINTMVMSSSKSPNFGRGFTIRIVHLDEYAFFDSGFDAAALENSVGGNAIYFRISTANGKDKHFYPSVLAARGRANRSQVYIFYEWWHNPENWYGSDDFNRRTQDVGYLTPGVAADLPLELVRDELFLLDRFPKGKDPDGYIAFRRRKLADALKNKANDPRAALASFLAEFPEDDVRPFENLINPIFDTFILDQQVKMAEREIVVDSWTDKGMEFRAWRRPMPGHSYAGGLDYSAMKGRDAASLQVKDLSTGEYVAEMHGSQGNTVPDVTSLAVKVMSAYNMGLLIPETNNMGRTQGDFARRDLGYRNVYRRGKKPAESYDSKTYMTREYGFETTEESRKAMIVQGQSHFNTGRIRILNADLASDMRSWNPEQVREGVDGTKKHFPDRLSGFFLIEVVDPQPDKSTLYGGASAPKKQQSVGWPRQAARPFAHGRS